MQQDVFIFTGDIKGNITLNNDKISLEEVKAAARTVNADSFIEKLPGGYDEPVTEREVPFQPDSGSFCLLRERLPMIRKSLYWMKRQRILIRKQRV